MKPLRVACVASHPSPNQRDLFLALARRPEVRLHVFYQETGAPDHSPWAGLPRSRFEHRLRGTAWGGWTVRFQWNWPLPRADAFDVWILHGLHYSPALQYLMRWHLRHVPWIFWGDGLWTFPGGWRRTVQSLSATALAGADAIVAAGSAAAADYTRRLPGTRAVNLPYAINLEPFQRAATRVPRQGDRPVRILFCGQLIRRKGIDVLLEAFGRLVAEGRDVRLVLVGQGPDAAAPLAALPEAARARVESPGFVQPERLPEIFARTDLFVLPSRREGWGVVVNQAIGAGLPVVVTDTVGAVELVRPGWNGRVVPSEDAPALAAALATLSEDAALRRTMGENSAALSREISPAACAAQWARLLNEVAGRPL